MTSPDPVCGKRDGQRHTCTRPPGHAGGHLDEPNDTYWQADES